MDDRFIDLESRLAFQEHTLQEVSDVMARQQQEIEALRLQVTRLNEQVKAMAPSNIARPEEETPPPHY